MEPICVVFHLIILKEFKFLNSFSADIFRVSSTASTLSQGVAIGITNNVNVIQNKLKITEEYVEQILLLDQAEWGGVGVTREVENFHSCFWIANILYF